MEKKMPNNCIAYHEIPQQSILFRPYAQMYAEWMGEPMKKIHAVGL